MPGEVANEFYKEQLERKLTVTLVFSLNSILKQFHSFRKRNIHKVEQMFLLGNFNIVENCFLVTLRAFDKLSSRFVLFSLNQRNFHSSVPWKAITLKVIFSLNLPCSTEKQKFSHKKLKIKQIC